MIQEINSGELHIWWANLRDFDSELSALQSTLSSRERARAERFGFLRNKKNHIIGRGILRTLLGSYVQQSPSALNFPIGGDGKLELRRNSCGSAIYFNLSHSGDMALYGITLDCPIGLDVEYIRPIPRDERAAIGYFSQSGADTMGSLPRECQSRHFFDLWTRKEALLKAMGGGRENGRAIREAFLLESRSEYFTCEPVPRKSPNEWSLRSFSPASGYIAAVAFQKPNLKLSVRSISNLCSAVAYAPAGRAHRNQGWN